MNIVHAADWKPVPWRNGAGIMFDLAHVVDGAGATLWRSSVADIERDCMFSHFDAIDRYTIMLSGAGCRLNVDGLDPLVLHDTQAIISYPGDRETRCTVLDGPLRVLNVMVGRGTMHAAVERRRIDGPMSIGQAGDTSFLFCLDGDLTCAGVALAHHDCVYGSGPIACEGHADVLLATLSRDPAQPP